MPIYTIKDNQTGKIIKIRGDTPPSETDINRILDEVSQNQGGFFDTAKNIAGSFVQPLIDYSKYVGEAGAQSVRAISDPAFRKSVLQGTPFDQGKLTPEENPRLS